MPSAYSCESATLSHWSHRDLRVSADAVAVGNDLHSCSRPQAILKVRHLRSLDYRPRQRSCLEALFGSAFWAKNQGFFIFLPSIDSKYTGWSSTKPLDLNSMSLSRSFDTHFNQMHLDSGDIIIFILFLVFCDWEAPPSGIFQVSNIKPNVCHFESCIKTYKIVQFW